MIISEHALRGNCNKLVKEFLSILESATTWLDIIFMNVLYEAGSRESDTSARSFIVSVMQPVRGRQCSFIFAALLFHEASQLSAVDHLWITNTINEILPRGDS